MPNTTLTDTPPNAVESVLQRYYSASSPRYELIESALLDQISGHIRRWLRTVCTQPDDILEKHSEANYRLILALRRSREPGERPVENLFGLAKTIVAHLTADSLRRDNPWYALRMRVYYLTTDERYKEKFARWQAELATLIGLLSQFGRSMCTTRAYEDFCAGDDRFVQVSLQGRHPANTAQVKLPELLERFLSWIETPLEEPRLIDHLAELQGIVKTGVEFIEDIAVARERSADELFAAPEPEREDQDWDTCLTEIRALPQNSRRVLLLSLNCDQLRMLLGQSNPAPAVAEMTGFPITWIREILSDLPLDDPELAKRMETTKSNIHAMRSRARAHLRRKFWRGV